MSATDITETSKVVGRQEVEKDSMSQKTDALNPPLEQTKAPEENGKKSDSSSPDDDAEGEPIADVKPDSTDITDSNESKDSDKSKPTAPEDITVVSPDSEEKSEESTLTDKSSESASMKVIKGVGALVQKFKSLSPKKKTVPVGDISVTETAGESVASLSPQPELLSPKMMELSPGLESSPVSETTLADVQSSDRDTDNSKNSEEESAALSASLTTVKKSSPLKNIIERCREIIGSPKKGADDALKMQTAESTRPTYLEVVQPEDCPKVSDKNVFQSVFDKTRAFIKRKASQLLDQDSFSSSEGSEPRHYLDTPSSGVLGDLSDTSTSTMTASSSAVSTVSCIFDDPKARKMSRMDTVIEVPKQAGNLPLEKIKSEETVGLLDAESGSQSSFEMSRKATPPLQRQARVKSSSAEDLEVLSKPESGDMVKEHSHPASPAKESEK